QDVDRQQLCNETAPFNVGRIKKRLRATGHKQAERNHDVHHRPSQGDHQFLHGLLRIRSNRATPPIGSKVISGVLIPKAFAASACPNSCRTTQAKSSRMKSTRAAAAAEPPSA